MQAVTYDNDFYADDFIRDPIPRYADMRAKGPVLWLPHQNAYAVTRHAEVVEVLNRTKTFLSGKGISMSDDVNRILIGSTINSDGEAHHRRRKVTATPLLPKSIEPLEQYIHLTAESLADRLVAQQQFDAVMEFAQILPYSIVIDLIGLNDGGKANMLKWAAATFDLLGGMNARGQEAFETLVELRDYLDEHGRASHLKTGGLARRIFEVAPDHGCSPDEAAQLMRDYIAPSLDTTISAGGFMALLFAQNPDQWDRLRAQPDLAANTIEEIVRLATPIRSLSRYIAEDTTVAGVDLPAGGRMMAVFASANRDTSVWNDPDGFDIGRRVKKHVGFGFGVHTCMGLHLARRELINLLEAMMKRVARWELVGEPQIAMNNTIRAYSHLPVKVHPL